ADPQLQVAVCSLAERRDHWGERSPSVVVASLRYAGVVDQRPAKAGPDVVELPDHRAAAVRLPASIVLDAELEPLCLADHGEVDVLLDAARKPCDDLQHRIVLVFRVVLVVVVEAGAVHLELIIWEPAPQRG